MTRQGQVDEMTCRLNDKLMKWQDNNKLMKWLDSNKLMKWHVDEVTSSWNGKFVEWQVDEITENERASRLSEKLAKNDKLAKTASWQIS